MAAFQRGVVRGTVLSPAAGTGRDRRRLSSVAGMARSERAANASQGAQAGETRIGLTDGADLGMDRARGAPRDPGRVGGGSASGRTAERVSGDLRGSRDVLLRRCLRTRPDRGGPE